MTGTLYMSLPITPTTKKSCRSFPGRLRELRVPLWRLLAPQMGLLLVAQLASPVAPRCLQAWRLTLHILCRHVLPHRIR